MRLCHETHSQKGLARSAFAEHCTRGIREIGVTRAQKVNTRFERPSFFEYHVSKSPVSDWCFTWKDSLPPPQ